jgi:EAL domain-containing protein (putative c-di-GMP-specific phosphodiesterase class I)
MHERVDARLRLESRIRDALANDEFWLAYQPEVCRVAAGAIASVGSAPPRWRDPVHGELLPAEFIDVAEETGLSLGIGEWVLAEACREACKWSCAGEPPRVAVNISALQSQQPELPGLVELRSQSRTAAASARAQSDRTGA